VVSNQKATTDHLVAALWPNGHRGDSGELPCDGELWPNHKIEPETPVWCNKNMTRCVSSPWGRWCDRLGRGWSELSVLTWIPANLRRRELVDGINWRRLRSIPSLRVTYRTPQSLGTTHQSLGWPQSPAPIKTPARSCSELRRTERDREGMRGSEEQVRHDGPPGVFIWLEVVLSSTRTWSTSASCRPCRSEEEEDDDLFF
jgi:hypothetical protein